MSLASWLCSVPGADTAREVSGLDQYQPQAPSVNYSREPGSIPVCRSGLEDASSGDAFDKYLNPAQTYTYTTPEDYDLPITDPESCDPEGQSKSNYHHHDHRQYHHHHHSDRSQSGNGWLGITAASTASATLAAGAATVACTSKKPLTREEYDALQWHEKLLLRSKKYGLGRAASYLSGLADEQVPQASSDDDAEERTQGWLSWGGSMAWNTGASIASTVMGSLNYIRDTVTAASVSAYEIASKRVNRWYTLGQESGKTSLTGIQRSVKSELAGAGAERTRTTGVTETTEITEGLVEGPSHSAG